MKITKEGHIKIDSNGTYSGYDFHVKDGTMNELQAEIERRIILAGYKLLLGDKDGRLSNS